MESQQRSQEEEQKAVEEVPQCCCRGPSGGSSDPCAQVDHMRAMLQQIGCFAARASTDSITEAITVEREEMSRQQAEARAEVLPEP